MARPIAITDRARGALVGLARGYAGEGNAADTLRGEAALAMLLAEELLEPVVDLRRLAGHWIAWARLDGRGLDHGVVDALEHLAQYDSPRAATPGRGPAGSLVRVLPIALVAATQPRNLVSGTWHTVMLTPTDPATAWSAVAGNVALAQLLLGRRDFLPDVIEALRANDAAGSVLSAARRIPFVRSDDLDGGGHPAIACLERGLWMAHHETRPERGFETLSRWTPEGSAVAGALLGAREGEPALPEGAVPEADRVRALAKRLVTPREPAA